eukprot:620014-Amphidinium_carterae.1
MSEVYLYNPISRFLAAELHQFVSLVAVAVGVTAICTKSTSKFCFTFNGSTLPYCRTRQQTRKALKTKRSTIEIPMQGGE